MPSTEDGLISNGEERGGNERTNQSITHPEICVRPPSVTVLWESPIAAIFAAVSAHPDVVSLHSKWSTHAEDVNARQWRIKAETG